MPFSEAIKKETRRKSAFACCICRKTSVSVEIHHIIPQEKNGPDTFDNAAPLCPSCHGDYGGNEEKRSRIKEMRDWWYEIVEKRFKPSELDSLDSITHQLSNIGDSLPTLKEDLKEFIATKINEITPQNASIVVSSILSSAIAETSSIKRNLNYKNGAYWADGDDEPLCSRCWEVEEKAIHMHPLGNRAYYQCPNCKADGVKVKPDLDNPPKATIYYPSWS